MAGEGGGRPLLPQTTGMQNISFAPATLAPRENQRNYVFVDEHNRHKRLKVMRACEGCRRRKIKCDAATTNSWPCAACIRLKLNCVPPTVSYDKDFNSGSQTFELDRTQEFELSPTTASHEYQRPQQTLQAPGSGDAVGPHPQSTGPYDDSVRTYPPAPYLDTSTPSHDNLGYGGMPQQMLPLETGKFQPPPVYSGPPSAVAGSESDSPWRSDAGETAAITEALGDLKIDNTGLAPWMVTQKKVLARTPAVEEAKVQLPPSASDDLTVRIPPEMMPSDQQALSYFNFYFTNIHPYMPVLSKVLFYQQWQHDRESISPLVLEAVFSCTCLMLGDKVQGHKWLALASKHEEAFKDTPRLSTLQAMLIFLKARESAPQKGYFHRSWMSIVELVAVAKDLDLHEHLSVHQLGQSCGSTAAECVVKTRCWHMLFVLEMMIGGPQGRSDYGVGIDTVDFDMPRGVPGLEDSDLNVSRQFAYLLRVVRNVRQSTQLFHSLRRKKKDWGGDPEFVAHNQDFLVWPNELPRDLQIHYPPDGTAPWIPSHFVANLHSYHHLSLIMHHRPQLDFMSNTLEGRQHFNVCYEAAKCMCRLQEAVLQNFTQMGLLCMLRGIGFTVYAVLTCTMLHLAALTSPDSTLNSEARGYFVRHMRILEQCIRLYPVPEMHAQVNALREAFSADTSKPFSFKPSFPYPSPGGGPPQPSPISSDGAYHQPTSSRIPGHDPSIEQPGQVNYHPITPPISSTDADPKTDSPVVQSLVMMATGQQRTQPAPTTVPLQETGQWNPSRIFDQWNVAFGTPPSSNASQPSPPLRPPPSGTFDLRTPQETPPHPSTLPHHGGVSHAAGGSNPEEQISHIPGTLPSGHQQQLPPPVSYAVPAAPAPSYVTPSMWQDVVASSFTDGVKRRWDYADLDQHEVSKRPR